MRKPLSEGKSSRFLTIRVNEAQLAVIKKRAQELDISQTQYLLELVEKDIENENYRIQ